MPEILTIAQACEGIGGSLFGLCSAGFALGCNTRCVVPGVEHEWPRCRILNRKFNEEAQRDAPWLEYCVDEAIISTAAAVPLDVPSPAPMWFGIPVPGPEAVQVA